MTKKHELVSSDIDVCRKCGVVVQVGNAFNNQGAITLHQGDMVTLTFCTNCYYSDPEMNTLIEDIHKLDSSKMFEVDDD